MIPEVRERYDQVRNGIIPQGYKQTALGIVPQEWEEFSLGEIYSERKQAGDPSLPVLSVSIHTGVSDGELDEESLGKKVKRIEDKTQYRTALEGDLVFNMMRAWQGAIGVVRSRGLVSPAYIVAKPGDRIYPPFMDYYMKTPRMINLIQRMSYGVTDFRLRLYWDSFEQIPCVLPPLQEQKRIVDILNAHDTLIDLGQQKIEQLKQMKKVLLKKMFPQKDGAIPEIRFPGFTAPWEPRKIADIASETRSGGTPSTSTETYWKGDIPWIQSSDLTEGKVFGVEPRKHISKAGLNGSATQLVPENSIAVVTRVGVGKLAYMHYSYTTSQDFLSLCRVHTEPFFTVYGLYQMLQGELSAVQGTSIKGITREHLLSKKISVPNSMDEQTQIGAFFKTLDNLIALHQHELEAEQKKKKTLTQLLLTGIVRV